MLETRSLSHRLDGSVQTALMTRCLVLVNDVLVRDTVDHADVFAVGGLSSGLVASFNCLDDLLDRGAQTRAQARVMTALLNCLTSTFSCLCAICHENS